ncbi:hypothetical protein Tco_0805619, partial [Tanacetum coccineum]
PEPFSLSVDLNIKSPKYSQAEECSALLTKGKLQLHFFRYLEDQDYLHFSLCSNTEIEEDLSKNINPAWLTIPS